MDRGGDGRDRARLLASYDAQGCRDIAALDRRDAVRPQRRDDGGLFGQLFGGGIERRDRYEDDRDGYDGERVRTFINPYPSGGGSYRTLCVRACDGYYWPMSYASSMGDFGRDEQNCRTMCPGTEVRLFFHRVPDQESEQMVSGDGTAYTDLPNAFKYRDASFVRPEQCGCNPNRNFAIIAGDGRGIQPLPSPQEEVPTLVPLPRPDPAADPDTLAQRDGGLTAPLLKQILRARPDAGPPDAERRIRVVGPAYLPDPEAAEDQPVPDRTVIR
jgi:hypothetical protein